MKSILKTILLFIAICGINGASNSRQKHQLTFEFFLEQESGRNQGQEIATVNPPFGQQEDPVLMHGQFVGFGTFRLNPINRPVGRGLTLGLEGGRIQFITPPSSTKCFLCQIPGLTIPGKNGLAGGAQLWEIGHKPTTKPTISTTASPTVFIKLPSKNLI